MVHAIVDEKMLSEAEVLFKLPDSISSNLENIVQEKRIIKITLNVPPSVKMIRLALPKCSAKPIPIHIKKNRAFMWMELDYFLRTTWLQSPEVCYDDFTKENPKKESLTDFAMRDNS